MHNKPTLLFKPIGIIHSPYRKLEGIPHQPIAARGVKGSIELDNTLLEGFAGLGKFSHIFLLYHLHESKGYSLSVIPHSGTSWRGLFATRTPRRPNPIGLSLVRLEKIEHNIISIKDVDILDGTPLLDIKPYIPEIDQPARVSGE